MIYILPFSNQIHHSVKAPLHYIWSSFNAFSEFQQVVMGLKREHKESLDRVERDQEVNLFNLRGEQAEKLCQYEQKIRELEVELEKLKTVSAIQVRLFSLGDLFLLFGLYLHFFFFLFGIGDVYVWNIFLFYIICYDFFPPSTWCILCLCLEKFFIYESCFIIFITVWIFCACQSYIIFSLSLLVLSLF